MSSRVPHTRCLQDRVSAPAAIFSASPTSPGRFEVCPSVCSSPADRDHQRLPIILAAIVWCPRHSVRGGAHSLQRKQGMPAAIFRSGAERTAKTIPRGGDAELLMNPAWLLTVMPRRSQCLEPEAGLDARFLPHGLSRPFTAFPGRPCGCFCLIWVTGCRGWVILHCTTAAPALGAAANRP